MRIRLGRLWIVLGALLLVVGGALLAVLLPRRPALRCLLAFQEPAPEDLSADNAPPPDLELLEDEARYGARRVWLRRAAGGRRPTIVLVHGVAPEGLEDGRILWAVRAFGAAGFTVLAPELPTLVDPLDPAPVGAPVARVLRAVAAGAYAGAHPRRIGVVGISVGGSLALRGCCAFRAEGGVGLRAILAIGAPDDMRRAARSWFEAADPAPTSDGSLVWERANAAAFARSFLIRAGLVARHGRTPQVLALDRWMATAPLPEGAPEGVTEAGLLALAALVRAPPARRSAQREEVLAAAATRIRGLSPALWSDQLAQLAGVAVFLLHGHGDPLVPLEEAAHLARRLRRHTVVSLLESRVVGHTTVNHVGLDEQLAHVVHMDDFFDMVAR